MFKVIKKTGAKIINIFMQNNLPKKKIYFLRKVPENGIYRKKLLLPNETNK
jgi:hypothetical protein